MLPCLCYKTTVTNKQARFIKYQRCPDSMLPNQEIKSLENKILFEQVTILFNSMVSLLLINLFVCTALAITFWEVSATWAILLWVGLMLLMIGSRLWLYLLYKKNINIKHLKRIGSLLIVGSAFAGMIWGVGGVLLFPKDQLEYQVLLVFAFLAMTGGSTFTLSIYMPTFYAFVPLVLFPITIKLITLGETVHLMLAAFTTLYFIALSQFNIKIKKSFKWSMRLRFENVELVEQLKEQKIEAENANKAKSKFLAAASHDLRQPLYSLSLFTSVLNETESSPKTKKVIQHIDTSVDALKGLFNALLDISKLDAGAVEVNKASFSLQPLFKKLSNAFDIQASEKNLKIYWPEQDFYVFSESDLLEQILRNYLENAVRYTDIGHIKVTCENLEGHVAISISDTGIGIANEELEEIFREFHQTGNIQRDRKKGMGLGLAIVDRTAKLLGHRTSVSSELNVGSTFTINVQKSTETAGKAIAAQNKPAAINRIDQIVVAIVDDEESIREGLSQLLQLWRFKPIIAASAAELIQALQMADLVPDILITDYNLSNNENGLDVILAVNTEYGENIPCLIVTGETNQERISELNSGNFKVLHKPLSTANLQAFLIDAQKDIRAG